MIMLIIDNDNIHRYVPALHYELQTFTERRETCWSYAPHRQLSIHLSIYLYLSVYVSIYLSICICRPDTADTAATPPTLSPAPAPLPWQMVQPPARMFREEVRILYKILDIIY